MLFHHLLYGLFYRFQPKYVRRNVHGYASNDRPGAGETARIATIKEPASLIHL